MRTATFSEMMYGAVNFLLAAVLSVPALLLLGAVYGLRFFVSKRPRPPFFYAGIRLGKNVKPFRMYKIRTLHMDDGFERQGKILTEGSLRELPLGKFLRDSRLDELPQLWNVVNGTMNLVGPRPLRPSVYEGLRHHLSGCGTRFRVKPGLTGYAQFLTPSHTPKRIRFAIDNYYINKGPHLGRDFFLICWTIREVLHKSLKGMLRRAVTQIKIFKTRGHGTEERAISRYRSKYIWIQFTDVGFSDHDQPMISIYDINQRAVSFVSSGPLSEGDELYFYLIGCKECETGARKRARCCGYVSKIYPPKEGAHRSPRYVVSYEPVSLRHRYLIDHYVLHATVA